MVDRSHRHVRQEGDRWVFECPICRSRFTTTNENNAAVAATVHEEGHARRSSKPPASSPRWVAAWMVVWFVPAIVIGGLTRTLDSGWWALYGFASMYPSAAITDRWTERRRSRRTATTEEARREG